jgi:hypothetical protein
VIEAFRFQRQRDNHSPDALHRRILMLHLVLPSGWMDRPSALWGFEAH